MVGGDFNAHHPLWNPRTYTRHDEEADEIVEMMTELELNLMLPAGSIVVELVNYRDKAGVVMISAALFLFLVFVASRK